MSSNTSPRPNEWRDHRMPLRAPDRDVDIKWINLDPKADAADSFGGNQCRAGTEESIEYNFAAGRAVEDGIGYQGYRLDGRGRASRSPSSSGR